MKYIYKFFIIQYIFSNINSIKLMMSKCYNYYIYNNIDKSDNDYKYNTDCQNEYDWFIDID